MHGNRFGALQFKLIAGLVVPTVNWCCQLVIYNHGVVLYTIVIAYALSSLQFRLLTRESQVFNLVSR